jgi:Transcriptional regulator, AbiEi antitoxin N-terminal domain
MAAPGENKLRSLYVKFPMGTPLTSADLTRLGISADLAVHYARSGWLTRLARGVYLRPGEELSLHPSLRLLESKIDGLHVGGKTALDWYGVRHHVSQQSTLHLYGWAAARLPDWFQQKFPSECHRKRMFLEQPSTLLHAGRLEGRADAPLTSEP